jgi:leader peptidase (prepilin peptidase) / N-methyltransferase
VLTALVCGVAGFAVGPLLAAWTHRAPTPMALITHGGWGGGDASPRRIAVFCAGAAVLFALCGYRFAGNATVVAWCWLCATGLVLAVVDAEHHRLPFPTVAAMGLGGVACLLAAAAFEHRWINLADAVASGVIVFGAALAIQMAIPSHTGGGDTALYGALAVFLGWQGFTGLIRGLLLATTLTAVLGLVLIVKRKTTRVRFPAGPTLILGTVIAILLA